MEAFLRYWPFVRGIHRSPVNSPHKGQWHNREAGDLRRHRGHYDVNGMVRTGTLRGYCCAVWNILYRALMSLQWRHNECDGVSNHQPHDCLLNRLFRRVSKKKNQSSASPASVWGIHRWPVNFPHKWPVTRKMFSFDDVTMVTRVGLYSLLVWLVGRTVNEVHQYLISPKWEFWK